MDGKFQSSLLILLLSACAAEKTDSSPDDTGDAVSSDADADADADADTDADADADADTDLDDTGDPPPTPPLEGVGAEITATTLAMNCAPPTSDDPLMGAIDVEIDNATARNFELDFSAFLTIDGSSPSPVTSRINLSPNRWVVETRTTVNLSLEKSGGFVAESACDLCGKTLDIAFAATAADGSAAAASYSTSVACTY